MISLTIDYKSVEKIQKAIKIFGENADQEIADYLDQEGGKKIMKSISGILPVSGRVWPARKTSPAKKTATSRSARVFGQEISGPSITVKTKKNYHYLYFPDDGSNTRHHRGNLRFMIRGAEKVADEIVDGIVEKLTGSFNGG